MRTSVVLHSLIAIYKVAFGYYDRTFELAGGVAVSVCLQMKLVEIFIDSASRH